MEYIDVKYINDLLNTYIYLEDYETDLIVLSYNIDVIHHFDYEDYLKEVKSSDLYIENFKIDNKSMNFVFRIPEKYSTDYNKFVIGKYSKISTEAKSVIINTLVNKYNIPTSNKKLQQIKDVLYLGDDLRSELEKEYNMVIGKDWELSSIIDSDSETFKLDD